MTITLKSMMLIACSLLFCNVSAVKQKPSLYILIHGTWASSERWHRIVRKLPMWYQPGHKSFEALKKRSNGTVVAHIWSGNNHLNDRIAGAKTLVPLIKKYAKTHTVYIIGHSHGGNVALLALDLLAHEQKFTLVHELILLGTPLYLDWYPQSLKAVHRIYNIFSYGDIIQPVGGMYERVLPEHDHIFNIQVKTNSSCPMHNQLYKVEILEQVPRFHRLFGEKGIYCLHCKTGKEPVITHDFDRKNDMLVDKKFIQKLTDSWIETREQNARNNNSRFARLRDRWTQYRKAITTFVDDVLSADEA